jgi:hypothetical protein
MCITNYLRFYGLVFSREHALLHSDRTVEDKDVSSHSYWEVVCEPNNISFMGREARRLHSNFEGRIYLCPVITLI